MVTATGLQGRELEQAEDLMLVNRGALAEQSLTRAETTLPSGDRLDFELLSLPLYLICQVRRLAELMLLP